MKSRLGDRIQSRSCLVEDDDCRISQDHAGDCHALALTAGKTHAPVADDGVKSIRHGFDGLSELGNFEGLPELII